jgi:hypothetical protein
MPSCLVVRRAATAVTVLMLTLTAGACGGGSTSSSTSGAGAIPRTFNEHRLDPAIARARVLGANRWLPLKPGTQWVRQGATNVGHRRVPHRVVSTVTDVYRQVAGVSTILVLDVGIDSGQVAHRSVDYFAEDRNGAVWNLGGYAEAYEGGRFTSVRDAWLAGVNGSRAGMLMPADPRLDTPSWFISQPAGADPDVAQVVSTGHQHCVPFRCFAEALIVREGKASAPDNEFKFYAGGIGQIDNIPRSASIHKDAEQLINVTRLTPRGLAEASSEALKLDKHARTTARNVFAQSPPATRTAQ